MNEGVNQQRIATETLLGDLFDLGLMRHCLDERLIVARRHPSCALTILNYTERCQYERGLWNPVTLACRGLIHDDAGRVVARPFRKFFNYGDATGGEFNPSAPVVVTDKLDGSLGILYPCGDGHAIATRGSFESEQAIRASKMWRERYAFRVTMPRDWTFLFEIIYPSNRIVLDYGERDELVLLGAVQISTGRSISSDSAAALLDWPAAEALTFDCPTLADALALPPRPNSEGVVVHFRDTDERLKIKQEDYVALHRIVTGLNERTVWEHLLNGKAVDELLGALPDEFHGWVREVAARLLAIVDSDAAEVERAYSTILTALPADHSRKDFALMAKDHPMRGQLFARLDGKDYRHTLWDRCRPEPRIGPRATDPEAE